MENNYLKVQIANPQDWLFLTKEDIPYLDNPYISNSKRHYALNGQKIYYSEKSTEFVDWKKIGRIVSLINEELKTLIGGEKTDFTDICIENSEILTRPEQKIIDDWFGHHFSAVRWAKFESENWELNFTNGRHRVWSFWKANPKMILPALKD